MCAWKNNEKIDFDFCDCQLEQALNSESEDYIKSKCRERIKMVGTYILLIGQDTRYKYKYVKWEAEVAIEQGCRIIGVNLDKWRYINEATCPPVIKNVGAVFIPFSPQIIAYALEDFKKKPDNWYFYKGEIYAKLGYVLTGNMAERQTPLSKLFPGSTLLRGLF